MGRGRGKLRWRGWEEWRTRRGDGFCAAEERHPSRCEDEVGADGSGRARGRRRGRAGPWPMSPGGAGALGGVARLTRSAATATATGRPWRRDRVLAPAMCETEGNNPDGSKAHRVFDFARGWARRRAGGGSSTTDRSDGRNSSGGRQWQDRFWRIRPGSSSTRGLGSWKRWRGRCSHEESRRGCRRWSESTRRELGSVRAGGDEGESSVC